MSKSFVASGSASKVGEPRAWARAGARRRDVVANVSNNESSREEIVSSLSSRGRVGGQSILPKLSAARKLLRADLRLNVVALFFFVKKVPP